MSDLNMMMIGFSLVLNKARLVVAFEDLVVFYFERGNDVGAGGVLEISIKYQSQF